MRTSKHRRRRVRCPSLPVTRSEALTRRVELLTGNSKSHFCNHSDGDDDGIHWRHDGKLTTPLLLSPLFGIFTLKLPNIIRPNNISPFCFNLPQMKFQGRGEHLTACILLHLHYSLCNCDLAMWCDFGGALHNYLSLIVQKGQLLIRQSITETLTHGYESHFAFEDVLVPFVGRR